MTIKVGAKFQDKAGRIWKVIELLPGGRLEMFNAEESSFARRLYREVKNWTRVGVSA